MKIFNAYTKTLVHDTQALTLPKGQVTDPATLAALSRTFGPIARATVGGGVTVGLPAGEMALWIFPATTPKPKAATPAPKPAQVTRTQVAANTKRDNLTQGEKIALAAYHKRLAKKAVAGK